MQGGSANCNEIAQLLTVHTAVLEEAVGDRRHIPPLQFVCFGARRVSAIVRA